MDYLKINRQIWEQKVADGYDWTRPVSSEEVDAARNGQWEIVLTPSRAVPRDWFPEPLAGKQILCLASGGGQQGPIMAAAGADVTVLDYSAAQLGQDLMVAQRDGLVIKTIQADMRDFSMFADESFDLIIHPWSNGAVDSVIPIWEGAYRVLRKGGSLLSGFSNPVQYIFDLGAMMEGRLVVRHKLPYSDLTSISQEELQTLILDKGEGICFGHTLEDQIQGQIQAGFLLAGFYEDTCGCALDDYMLCSIATRAIKL